MKIHIAVSRKVKPAMPLTSLDESITPSGLKVVSTASPNKITANIKISNPNTISSVFMNCRFVEDAYNILCGLCLCIKHQIFKREVKF